MYGYQDAYTIPDRSRPALPPDLSSGDGRLRLFAIAMLGLLIWVCSRPQTDDIRAAEGQSIARCWERSADPRRSAISRSAQADACREMEKQYVHKFGQPPAT